MGVAAFLTEVSRCVGMLMIMVVGFMTVIMMVVMCL